MRFKVHLCCFNCFSAVTFFEVLSSVDRRHAVVLGLFRSPIYLYVSKSNIHVFIGSHRGNRALYQAGI